MTRRKWAGRSSARSPVWIWLALAGLAAGCTGLNPSERAVSNMVPPAKLGVYTEDKVDVKPAIISEVQPEFPPDMYGFLTGKATVVFTVGLDGKATDAMVVQADDGEFGAAAMKAITKWRFRPAEVKSKPVPCRMTVPFVFDTPYGYDHSASDGGLPSGSAPSGAPPPTSISAH